MSNIFTHFWGKPSTTPTLDSGRWTATLISHFASATDYATSKLSGADDALRSVWRRGSSACATPASSAFSAAVVAQVHCQASQLKQFVASHISKLNRIPWASYTLSSGHSVFYPDFTVETWWILLMEAISLLALLRVLVTCRMVASWQQKAGRGSEGSVQYECSGVKMRTPTRGRNRSLSRTVDVAAVTDDNGRVVGRRRKSRGVRVTDRKMEKYEEAWMAKWAAMDD